MIAPLCFGSLHVGGVLNWPLSVATGGARHLVCRRGRVLAVVAEQSGRMRTVFFCSASPCSDTAGRLRRRAWGSRGKPLASTRCVPALCLAGLDSRRVALRRCAGVLAPLGVEKTSVRVTLTRFFGGSSVRGVRSGGCGQGLRRRGTGGEHGGEHAKRAPFGGTGGRHGWAPRGGSTAIGENGWSPRVVATGGRHCEFPLSTRAVVGRGFGHDRRRIHTVLASGTGRLILLADTSIQHCTSSRPRTADRPERLQKQ